MLACLRVRGLGVPLIAEALGVFLSLSWGGLAFAFFLVPLEHINIIQLSIQKTRHLFKLKYLKIIYDFS